MYSTFMKFGQDFVLFRTRDTRAWIRQSEQDSWDNIVGKTARTGK
jgi:hypothetical protein